MASMESGGTTAVAHHRSEANEFEFSNAAELEAHINMNATVARANFDKYYEDRLVVIAQTWKDTKRRLDVLNPFEVPVLILDVGAPKYDFASIATQFTAKIAEREEKKKTAEAEKAIGDGSSDLFIDHRVNQDDPLKLKLQGVDYTNVDKVVAVLKDMKDLKRLDLSNNSLDTDDAESLAALISGTVSIESLDLSSNKIGTEGVAKLVEALKANTSLTDLDLGANELGRRAGGSLSEVLASPSCKLERLQLAANSLGIYGAEELAVGVKKNKSLKSLGLQTNTIGDDGAGKLLTAFEEPGPNTSLLQVALQSNKISDDALLAKFEKHCLQNENHQQLGFMESAESDDRSNRETEVEREWKLLKELFDRKLALVKEVMASKAKGSSSTTAAAAKAPAAKPGAKSTTSKAPAPAASGKKCLSKSPERAPAKKTAGPKPSAQAPAPSSAVAKAAGKKSPARTASPKKAPAPKKK